MMMCRRLIQSVLCVGLVTSVATAYAADPDPNAQEAEADAAAGATSETKSEEAAPAADSTTVTKAEAKDGEEKNKAKKLAQEMGAANVAIAGGSSRPAYVAATLQFRTNVINDETPAGERSMNYLLTAGFHLFKGGQIFARMNLQQRFVAQGGALPDGLPAGTIDFGEFDESVNDSPFRLGNLQMAFMHVKPVKVELGDLERNVILMNRGSVFLPTSRNARIQNFYLGLEYLGVARTRLFDSFFINLVGLVQWRGHEFSTQAGQFGATLPRFVLLGQLALEYVVGLGETFGSLTIGADISGSESIRYPSRESFASDRSSQTFVQPGYGWDAYVAWVPLPFLSASATLTQGGNVVRNGIPNTFLVHRDETRLSFALTARY